MTNVQTKTNVLPEPGAVAKRIAEDALTPEVLAVRETPGKNNFGKWIRVMLASVGLAEGNPWCLAFVNLRIEKAAAALGVKLPSDYPDTGYTPTFANWAKKRGWWIPVADARARPSLVKRGDLVFFYGTVGAVRRIRHVGIVIKPMKNSYGDTLGVISVEGNTGPDGGRDGDGVYLKHRDWSELGALGGFVRLPF